MGETKWIPGPWEQWNTHGRRVVTTIKAADGTPICTLADGTDERVNAHARLLKSAPDLYRSLSDVLDVIESLGPSSSPKVIAARAALAKARGEGQ